MAYLCWLAIYSESDEPQNSIVEEVMFGTPMTHVALDEVYKDLRPFEDNDYNLLDEEQKEPGNLVAYIRVYEYQRPE